MKREVEFIKRNKKKIEIIIIVIILIMCAIIVGLNRIKTSNFNPINGDFQNYNPVRRFLNGEIPYKDFAVYLGTGHLFVLSTIQLLVGNNYTLSLFVSNMVTMLLFELTVFTVSFLMLKDKKKALYMTLFMALINLIRPHFVQSLFNKVFINALDFGMKPGNSARLIRISIMPILVLMIYLGFKFINSTKNKFIAEHKSILSKIYIAVIAGIAILWSNDGGIATYITVSFVYFLLLIKEYKKDIKYIVLYTLMYIGISVVSFFLLLTIVTRGNILSWFEFTFGVSSYQNWYYGEAVNKENISIFHIDLSIYNVFMILIALYYIYKIFESKNRNDVIRYSLLNILIIGSLLSTYLYQLLSGGTSNDILNLVFMVWFLCCVLQVLQRFVIEKKLQHLAKVLLILVSCGTIISNIGGEIAAFKDRESYVYIKELGGYFSKLGDSVKYAMKRIGNEKIFSTYASAIDVATGQFQPTGIDYIIHCMGDTQRQKYLEVFRQGDFKYVTTTDRDYHQYRYWIKNANWFFYRELYQNYNPVFATEYNVFWEKSDRNNNLVNVQKDTKITTSKKSKSKYRIEVETGNPDFSGVADVKLCYTSDKTKRFLKTGNINRYVYVKDVTGKSITDLKCVNYNIPNDSEEYYVPITIVDGTGILEIYSYPVQDTSLTIKTAEIMNIYDVNFKYCVLSKKHEIEDNTLYIDNTGENKVILKGVKAIRIGGIEQKVINYTEEEKYIKIEVEENADAFAYPNFFEVIK